MKKPTHSPTSSRGGFTLVELLVVIAIIVSLMGILIPVVGAAQRKAANLKAKQGATSLVTAVESFFSDYSRLPANNQSAPSSDLIVESTEPIMSVLAGINIDQLNRKEIAYFSGLEAKGSSRNTAYNGLWRNNNSAELYDPWRKKTNRGYFMLLDYNYDNRLDDPFRPGRQIGAKVVAWSSGKDAKWARSNPKRGENKDNVYSWF